MTAHVHLGLVFHQHQPVGNYGFVFEELYEKSYEPLVACLERHPGVKAGLHYSGPLLDWLKANRPDYVARIRALVTRGQVEILGGGYYEPILPSISEDDRRGQLEKMRDEVQRLFGVAPTGAWVAERVWEPELPQSLARSGYEWTIVDDVHFDAAGFHPDDLNGWFITEAEGEMLGVYGSSTRFRYLVPWGTVEDCVDFLRARGDRKPGCLVAMGDDGEKFGGWPTTYIHCWENHWVDDFFNRLEQESSWISTVHLGAWRRDHEPESLAYLPSSSYMEMGEWSLPPGDQLEMERAKAILHESGGEELVRFLRGGHWRDFLVRYPEVNLLHKRLLHLSKEAHRQHNLEAIDHIWQAQCNCPFWHGVFGGVYLEHIRHANFGHMAKADALLFPGAQPPDVRDWDYDGRDEVCLRSAGHLAIVAPGRGGDIQHWDLRLQGWHLTHAVARRPEAYHQSLTHDDGAGVRSIHDAVRVKDESVLGEVLRYDRGMRLAAQDTLLSADAGRDAYRDARLANPARVTHWSLNGVSLEMECAATGVTYRKTVEVGACLAVRYGLPGDRRLFSEWNLSLPSRDDGARPEFTFSPGLCRVDAGGFTLEAAYDGDDAWAEQLFTVSNTEGGVELAPQGWSVVFSVAASPGRSSFAIRWSATS